MKCLHCGNEPDRFSKWKGSTEFCSEECRRASQEESDKLAMRRLMQPRRATTVQRAASTPVTKNDGGVAVAEPAKPKGPEAPPEADFVWENAPVLAVLQLRSHPYTAPRPLDLCMPATTGTFSEDLAQLADSVKPSHPELRVRRPWPAAWMVAYSAVPGFAWSEEPSVTIEPEWRASLGYSFPIAGLDHPVGMEQGISALFDGPPAPVERPTAPAAAEIATPQPESAAAPVAHKSIPAIRPRLDYTAPLDHQIPADLTVPSPVVVAPRLRIHLPKPQILPLRPRYGFAPKPEAPAAKEAPKADSKPETKEPPKENAAQLAARRAQEIKDRDASRVKQIPAQPPKAKDTPKPEVKKEEARKAEPAPKVEPKKAEAKKEEARKPEPKKEELRKTEVRPEPVKAEAKPQPVKAEAVVESAAPTFGVKEEAAGGGKAKWAIAAVLVLCAGGGYMYSRSGKPKEVVLPRSAPPAGQITMGADSWLTDWAGDGTGSARGRQITLYKPARGKRDYIFEFSASAEQHAIGWAFRVKDNRNYYCMKLEWTGEGAQQKAQIVRFAVVNGEEQPHRVTELKQPLDFSKPARVILDVRGAQFSTQVNGVPVDHWMDNQLAEGTVGFTNERSERAVVRTVKVSY
jgi:hypothetical protein